MRRRWLVIVGAACIYGHQGNTFLLKNESDWEPGQDGLFWFSFSFYMEWMDLVDEKL